MGKQIRINRTSSEGLPFLTVAQIEEGLQGRDGSTAVVFSVGETDKVAVKDRLVALREAEPEREIILLPEMPGEDGRATAAGKAGWIASVVRGTTTGAAVRVVLQ